MSSDTEKREKGPGDGPRPPRDPRDAPRGRGLGSPTVSAFRCARCGELSSVGLAAAPDARCARCGSDLHTCTHCSHFDPAAAFQCRQPIRERVAKKDMANRCDLFDPRVAQEFEGQRQSAGSDSSATGGAKDPRAAFDALFKL